MKRRRLPAWELRAARRLVITGGEVQGDGKRDPQTRAPLAERDSPARQGQKRSQRRAREP